MAFAVPLLTGQVQERDRDTRTQAQSHTQGTKRNEGTITKTQGDMGKYTSTERQTAEANRFKMAGDVLPRFTDGGVWL